MVKIFPEIWVVNMVIKHYVYLAVENFFHFMKEIKEKVRPIYFIFNELLMYVSHENYDA